jgi:PhzF family phenazine biosynthesis protein
MKLAYRIVNVFGLPGEPLTGNPLCVFEDGRGIDDATMQALALQFNLSETTFILPSDRATARMRIFTPAMELPFAGHPTLGTAQVLRSLAGAGDHVTLETRAGVIAVAAAGDEWTLTANAPVTRPLDPASVDALIAALGLDAADLAAPPLWVDTGNEQLLVPLASREAVRSVSPLPGLAAFGHASGKVSVYCFSPASDTQMRVRYFFAKNPGSLAEDPATGSACANLGGYLLATGATLPLSRHLLQGEHVGRPSMLALDVDAARTIRVSGLVVELGTGVLAL